MPPVELPSQGMALDHEILRDWTRSIVLALDTPADIADDVAEVLVAADLRGIASHGTFRLPVYAMLAENGTIDTHARPSRVGGTAVISTWDGHDGWGQHGGRVLIDDAIARARSLGMAASVIRHASHFGIAGWYAMRAAAQGLVGLTMTNTSPLVAPTRGRGRSLGTNPLALAVPSARHGMFVLDMATSAVTWGRVLVADRRGETLQPEVAVDSSGRPTDVPSEVLDGGALLPLGGLEASAGYKGYGLSLMVDILTGVLAGASSGTDIVPFSRTLGPSDLGQTFVVIDPGALDADGFEARMDAFLDDVAGTAPMPDARGPVLVPGQPEEERTELQRRIGVVLDHQDHESLVALGERLSIAFPSAQEFARDEMGA